MGPLYCASVVPFDTTHTAVTGNQCDSGCASYTPRCVAGVTQGETLWEDRDYAWITAPADIMDGVWTYIKVPLEAGSGAPCQTEGSHRLRCRFVEPLFPFLY